MWFKRPVPYIGLLDDLQFSIELSISPTLGELAPKAIETLQFSIELSHFYEKQGKLKNEMYSIDLQFSIELSRVFTTRIEFLALASYNSLLS